ncbi:MAG: hypothetical protein IKF14_05515 [Atopobiaceae bacterium]|nr:hypothetical protein [Atopobiaceae bacterium]
MGEGSYGRFESLAGYGVYSTYVALLVSYGLVGLVGYSVLFGRCVWQKGAIAHNFVLLSGILFYQLVHNGIRNIIVWMLLATILCLLSLNGLAGNAAVDDGIGLTDAYD